MPIAERRALRCAVGGLRSATLEVGGRGQTTEGRRQTAEDRNQRSEIRRQQSGVKLISDLRLLTSVIDDFYAFYGFNDLLLTVTIGRIL
jgi:hypothetical protein